MRGRAPRLLASGHAYRDFARRTAGVLSTQPRNVKLDLPEIKLHNAEKQKRWASRLSPWTARTRCRSRRPMRYSIGARLQSPLGRSEG